MANVPDNKIPLPGPLDRVIRLLETETQPFRQVHRLIDAVEVLIKFHTVAVMSDCFTREKLSEPLKGMLASGLRTPSLGIWWLFCRAVAKQLDADGAPFVAAGMRDFILGLGGKKDCSLVTALDRDESLIAFRNSYAHGATPSDEACLADLRKYLPRFEALLKAAGYLSIIRLEPAADGRVWLVSETARIDLHPLLVYRPDEDRYYFYNDIRKPNASFLSYETAGHWRSRELLGDLLTRYPIDNWSQVSAAGFRERIEELTELFKGRREELNRLKTFLNAPRGFLTVWGGPGVGKSALLAQSVRELGWQHNDEAERQPIVLEYFIRRGQRTDDGNYFLTNLNRRIEENIPTGIPQGQGTAEQWECFDRRLTEVSQQLAGRKMLLVIDGLDEACGSGGELLRFLPRAVPPGILVIYASRPLPEVRCLCDELDREHRAEMTLEGLSPADTRAILYGYVSKYSLEDAYVSAVAQRSCGNPLFLKMLCEALASGDVPLNSLDRLPNSMESLYEGLLRRLRDADRAFDLLMLLTAAMDYLSAETVATMTGWSVPQAESALDAVMEILLENPLTPDVLDYQLFHESLRDYLKARYPGEAARWNTILAQWCGRWAELLGDAKTYALKFGVRHLESEVAAGGGGVVPLMEQRVKNLAFRSAQYSAAGLQTVLDDLRRVARQLFAVRGQWQDGLDVLLLHASEAKRLHTDEAARLRQLARAGNAAEVLAILGREQDSLARFLGTVLAAWELADAGHPFLEVLTDAEKVAGVDLTLGSAEFFRKIFGAIASKGLDPSDGERLLAAALAPTQPT
ncbi:MAG: ATP-binding protein [Planctomycetota bacterium]